MTARPTQIADTLRTLNAMAISLDDQIAHLRDLSHWGHGTIKLPQPGNSWDSQRLEITLHGIAADGASWPEAIRNWTTAARAELAGYATGDAA
jgi:hypothetical protein